MRYLHISQLFFWSGIYFLAGIAQIDLLYIWLSTIVVIVWYKLFSKQQISNLFITVITIIWILIYALGFFRYQTYIDYNVSIPYEQTVTFQGVITKPPVTIHTNQKLYVTSESFTGKVYIKTGMYPTYSYGDRLSVTCTLHKPEAFETFAFDKYLARYGVLSICSQAKIKIIETNQGNWLFTKLYEIRAWFKQEIIQLWPEPVASLILGVILGIQDDIPDDIVEQFRITGTIHILVVSGMHVIIIAQVLQSVLKQWLNPKKQLLIIGLTLFCFSVITGLAASVVRASIMGLLPLLAKAWQRKPIIHYSS